MYVWLNGWFVCLVGLLIFIDFENLWTRLYKSTTFWGNSMYILACCTFCRFTLQRYYTVYFVCVFRSLLTGETLSKTFADFVLCKLLLKDVFVNFIEGCFGEEII